MSNVSRPAWIPDDHVTQCHHCHVEFTFTRRKHHCRLCGFVFDQQCCPKTNKIALPSKYDYLTSQRVCCTCHHMLMTSRSNFDEQIISMQQLLRDSRYSCEKVLVDPIEISCEIPDLPKPCTLVSDGTQEGLLRACSFDKPLFPFSSEARRACMFTFLKTLNHPNIAAIKDLKWHDHGSTLHIVRDYAKKGSVRDAIYNIPQNRRLNERHICQPSENHPSPPTTSTTKPFNESTLNSLRTIGYQVLEALIFLGGIGYPFPHLHPGNVLIFGNSYLLTDIEASLGSRLPAYWQYLTPASVGANEKHREIVCFGLFLYEITTRTLPPPPSYGTLDLLSATSQSIPPEIRDILLSIFPQKLLVPALPPAVTLSDIIQDPFFSSVSGSTPAPPDPKLEKPIIALLSHLRDAHNKLFTALKPVEMAVDTVAVPDPLVTSLSSILNPTTVTTTRSAVSQSPERKKKIARVNSQLFSVTDMLPPDITFQGSPQPQPHPQQRTASSTATATPSSLSQSSTTTTTTSSTSRAAASSAPAPAPPPPPPPPPPSMKPSAATGGPLPPPPPAPPPPPPPAAKSAARSALLSQLANNSGFLTTQYFFQSKAQTRH
ncbi:hypothetical protein Pelo_778 [Pelomyxa schiedti]|nr:hypothetical protein Pelo_778 [Pelomyxa schiedti]